MPTSAAAVVRVRSSMYKQSNSPSWRCPLRVLRLAILFIDLSSAILLHACGSDEQATPTGIDTIAPSPITTLAARPLRWEHMELHWIATGDDGTSGRAARYDLRFAPKRITEANWDSAGVVMAPPTPGDPGAYVSIVVASPGYGEWDYAIKVVDDAGNASSLSNLAHASIVDVFPPGQINDLSIALTAQGRLRLAWMP